MSNVLVVDEYDTPWQVDAGDPGREAVLYLAANNYQWIVLPRAVLTGRVKYGIMKKHSAAVRWEGSLEAVTPPATVRLRQCLEALGFDTSSYQ